MAGRLPTGDTAQARGGLLMLRIFVDWKKRPAALFRTSAPLPAAKGFGACASPCAACSVALVLAGASAAAYAADVYRWVDDKGGVHYSDQWVPGSEVIKSSKPHPNGPESASPSRDPQRVAADRATSQISEENSSQAVKQDVAKAREQQCKEAKERYDKAVQARRIYKPAKDPGKDNDSDRPADREYLSEEEADAYRLQARNDMVSVCGPSAATAQASQ
jgi:hypothetical protein